MTLRRQAIYSVILLALTAMASLRIRSLEKSEKTLKQQVAVMTSFRDSHQRMCSLLQSRLQAAADVARRRGGAGDYDYVYVSDSFRKVIVFADACVPLPPATKIAAAGVMGPKGASYDDLAAGVVALDLAFAAAARSGWLQVQHR